MIDYAWHWLQHSRLSTLAAITALAQLLVARGLVRPEQLQPFTARPPVEPVTFGALAAGPAEEPAP